jgi:hypothetical protein
LSLLVPDDDYHHSFSNLEILFKSFIHSNYSFHPKR